MLTLEGLHKTYPPTDPSQGAGKTAPALRGVSITVEKGEFYTLLGPSGCGKTTMLQCIAGLETPDSGDITMCGEVVFSSARNIFVPASKRRLGMVFQSYAIWPHMTVFENVAFPLRQGGKGLSKQVLGDRVMAALDRVKLRDFANRPAPYLSGGQQQRVALARALVGEPRVILLDEPLSNLDAKLRDEMRVELRDLVKSLGITTIYVTHDQVEALSMSDRIALMKDGKVIQEGTPADLYMRPKTAFASEFVGRSNLIPGKVVNGSADSDYGTVAVQFGDIRCRLPDGVAVGESVNVMVRPHGIDVNGQADEINRFAGRVRGTSFVGEFLDICVDLKGCSLRVYASPYDAITTGQEVALSFPPDRCVVLLPDEAAISGEGGRYSQSLEQPSHRSD
ncbi:MAG: ABC transporter ATP-binding protein [Betaproteobacteria bacterium]|nr:ABC transporter ATP-binding protein [Betaproteobacteria bacterium]